MSNETIAYFYDLDVGNFHYASGRGDSRQLQETTTDDPPDKVLTGVADAAENRVGDILPVQTNREHAIFLSFRYCMLPEANGLKNEIGAYFTHDICWLCEDEIPAGGDIPDKIVQAIAKAKIMICCLSKTYAESDYCKKELQMAVNQKKVVIPVYLEEVDRKDMTMVNFHLDHKSHIKLYNEDRRPAEVRKLMASISQYLFGTRLKEPLRDPPLVPPRDDVQLTTPADGTRWLKEPLSDPPLVPPRDDVQLTTPADGEPSLQIIGDQDAVWSDPNTPSILDIHHIPWVPIKQEMVDSDEVYPMTSNTRGLALVINNGDFRSKPPRRGTEVDRQNLEHVFRTLGFNVDVKMNLKAQEMANTIKEFARMNHFAFDCVILVILTHGVEGAVYGVDERKLLVEDIYKCFDGNHAPTLNHKPKLIILQSCRGERFDTGVESSDRPVAGYAEERAASGPPPRKILAKSMIYYERRAPPPQDRSRVPTMSDMLIAYFTVPGLCRNMNICESLLKFDLQLQATLVILIRSSGTPQDQISLLEILVISIGIPYSIAYSLLGWLSVGEHWSDEKALILVTIIIASWAGLGIRIVQLVLFVRAVMNFGKGLKEKGWRALVGRQGTDTGHHHHRLLGWSRDQDRSTGALREGLLLLNSQLASYGSDGTPQETRNVRESYQPLD